MNTPVSDTQFACAVSERAWSHCVLAAGRVRMRRQLPLPLPAEPSVRWFRMVSTAGRRQFGAAPQAHPVAVPLMRERRHRRCRGQLIGRLGAAAG